MVDVKHIRIRAPTQRDMSDDGEIVAGELGGRRWII
jgi:hypothetical protein